MLFLEANVESYFIKQSSDIEFERHRTYIEMLNRFGVLVFNENTSFNVLRAINYYVDWQIEVKSTSIENISTMIQLGAKKLIFSKDQVKKVAQIFSKNIIIAKIFLNDVFAKPESNLSNLSRLIKELEPYCSEFLLVDDLNIDIPSKKLELYKELRKHTYHNLTVSLSKSNYEDAVTLEQLGISPLICSNKKLEEERLVNLFIQVMDFEKSDLIPTIVQNENNQVLMLVYSNRETIRNALVRQKGVYYSRSRNSIWIKGETSGHIQKLIKARYDCDRDTLLYTVRQTGKACHLNRYSCFGERLFGFPNLLEVIKSRIASHSSNSYTNRIANNEKLLLEKIREESTEILNFTGRANLIWEIADLFYFIFVLMVTKGIDIQDIINELWKRRNYEK